MSRCCSATASGNWLLRNSDLSVDSALTVSDRDRQPALLSAARATTCISRSRGDYVRATGALRHPASGTLVTDVTIEHRLSTGAGHAILDVPGLTFGPNFQPDETHPPDRRRDRAGQRHDQRPRPDRLDGERQGHLDRRLLDRRTSTSRRRSARSRASAARSISTTCSASTTPPGQMLTVKSINPGILVENGVIRYQLLPNQLVKIERGEWPFMGGRLILHETVLNFGRPSAKRLTFEVVGLDAHDLRRQRSASRSSTRPARSTACCR